MFPDEKIGDLFWVVRHATTLTKPELRSPLPGHCHVNGMARAGVEDQSAYAGIATWHHATIAAIRNAI
jgi:hypothetical protein